MLNHIKLENVLVLDIETVPQVSRYVDMPENFKPFWKKKAAQVIKEDAELADEEGYFDYAGIYAEFGKIICISVGAYVEDKDTGNQTLRIKSFYGKDEKKVLNEFFSLLNLKYHDLKKHALCGHNIKEFDVPYICRRALVNGLRLPKILDIGGLKPWEVNNIDTLQLWKFGDYKNYTSLNLLANIFGIPTPKDDIDGSMVADVFWNQNDLERIRTYCQKDVLTTAQLLLKYKGLPLISDEEVIVV